MKKIEYARNRSTGRNWAYHKKEEMYLKKLEMKQSMTEFLNRVKKVETPPLHFIYSNEVEDGSEQVRMKLAERYEDHSYLFNYGAVINDEDIIEMERRKNFNQKRPHTRSSTLKSDNSNNELNSKINLYFLHQNCGNCIRLRVNGTLVPEYFVRRSAFPNPPSSSSSTVSTPATKAATTSLHHSLPSFYITPPPSSSSTSTPTSSFPSSSFPSYSSIPSLTLNSSSTNPISSSSSSSSSTTTTSSLASTSSSSSSSSSTSSLEKRKRRQSSRIINKNINLKYEDEDDNDISYDANADHDDNYLKSSGCDDDDIKFNDYATQKDKINNNNINDGNNTDSDKLDDLKKNQHIVNSDTNDSTSHQSRSKKKNTKAAMNASKVETKGSKRGGFLLESCWALCTLRHRTEMHFSF